MAEPKLERPVRSSSVAAGLSFIWPGLGQAFQGRLRTGLAFALPVVVVVGLLVIRLAGRLEVAAVTLLDPAVAGALLLAVLGLGLWRLLAVWDAWRRGAPRPSTTRGRTVLGSLLVGILLMHAVAGYYAWAFYDAGSRIFTGGEPTPSAVVTAPPTLGPGVTAAPTLPPAPTQRPNDRITILLLGVDAGHDRQFSNTDTMLVASISPSLGTLTMVSFPRDIARFPMYSGGTYNGKLNSLLATARDHPERYPDGPARTLANQLGFLLGIPIQYTASINLVGFEQMINKVGGVDIDNPAWIDDPRYDWFDGTYGFQLSPGKHHLSGRLALAYVRSRQGAGDNDFKRADRQQQLLLALKDKLTEPDVITKLPDLLEIAGRTVSTDLPPELLRQSVSLAEDVNAATVQRVVLGPPYSEHPPTSSTDGIYTLRLLLDRLKALSIDLFGADSRYAAGAAPSPSQ